MKGDLMAKINYARVSTKDQKLDSQIDALKEYGCNRIFSEKLSGRKYRRTELDKCLDYMRDGDTLVINKLDRLGRTTKQLIELCQHLENENIDLQIIDMNITTKDAMGEMFFTMMSAFAELEANLLSERTKKGLDSARARGRVGGRPGISDQKKEIIMSLYNSRNYSGEEIVKMVDLSRSTIYKVITERKSQSHKDNKYTELL